MSYITRFLHFNKIDILEHAAIVNVIILQITLEELRNRSRPVYARVRSLIANPEKKFYVFCNEHHRSTYVQGLSNESINDRNDRAIRRAVEWYSMHVTQPIVLVSDDRACRELAKADGLTAFSTRQYVEKLGADSNLIDMVISTADSDDIEESQKFSYSEVRQFKQAFVRNPNICWIEIEYVLSGCLEYQHIQFSGGICCHYC